MNKKYAGITIGPIVKTLMLTTTPAGLWGASYIFSYFTKKLVEVLSTEFVSDEHFLVPAQNDEVRAIVEKCPWAGLYHDRIIFEVSDKNENKIRACIERAKKDLSEAFYNELIKETCSEKYEEEQVRTYIENYIQAYAVIMDVEEGENPIIKLGLPLDVLELQQSYIPKEKNNFILKFLENRGSLQGAKDLNRNFKIKNSFLLKNSFENRWHFFDNNSDNIVTIDDIVGANQTQSKTNAQRKKYYALVKVDGDNLGRVLKQMQKDMMNTRIRDFSTKCFEYAKEAFEEVELFGGKMIYAGGDDLLFISPVINLNNEKESIFDLLSRLEKIFSKCFEDFSFKLDDEEKKMGFSAGVMICYYKYPLCEALTGVLDQLNKSKNFKLKNSVSIHFEKHSGKQRGLQFKDFTNNCIFTSVLDLLSQYSKSDIQEDFLRSVGRKLEFYQTIFIEALNRDNDNNFNYLHRVVDNLFEEYPGIFDDGYVNTSKEAEYIRKVIFILEQLFIINTQDKREDSSTKSIEDLETIIALLSFYNEKEVE